MNIDQKKKEIMEKARKEIERAEIECSIIESLPIIPASVFVYPLYGAIGSARYNPVTKEGAINIFKAFKVLPSFVCKKNKSVSVKASYDESADEVTECLFLAEITKYDQKIRFYTQTKVGIVRIEIEMGFCPFGSFYVVDRNRTKYYHWEFRPENSLSALLRVANYARPEQYGEGSAPHLLYAGFEEFELYDVLGLDR